MSQALEHENLNITLEVYAHQLQEQRSGNDEKIKQMWTKRFKTAWLKAKKCPLPESNQQRLLRRELLYPFN